MPIIPMAPVASTTVPSAKHQGRCWLTHIPIRIGSLLFPLVAAHPRRLGQSPHPSPIALCSTTTSRVGSRGLAAQCASSTHPTASGAELYFGAGIVRIQSQIGAGRCACTQIQYQKQATPVSSEYYSFAPNSAYAAVSAQPHRY